MNIQGITMDKRGEAKGDINNLVRVLLQVFSRTVNIPLNNLSESPSYEEAMCKKEQLQLKGEQEKEQGKGEEESGV